MSDDFFNLTVEFVAVDHHHIATSEAHDFNIGPDADDLERLAPSETGMGTLHLHFIVEIILGDCHAGISSILTAAGTLGRPGIVKIEPVSGMMNRAPAERLTSRM